MEHHANARMSVMYVCILADQDTVTYLSTFTINNWNYTLHQDAHIYSGIEKTNHWSWLKNFKRFVIKNLLHKMGDGKWKRKL